MSDAVEIDVKPATTLTKVRQSFMAASLSSQTGSVNRNWLVPVVRKCCFVDSNWNLSRAMLRLSSLKSFLFLAFVVTLPAQTPAKPQYGAWGFDLAGADTKTKPGDDFFRYANGTWIDKTQIPPDKPAYSLRLAMTDLTEQRLHDLMESLGAKPNESPSTLEEKVGAFYHSFMDEARVEQLGAKAIDPESNDLKSAKTRDDLAALMGRTATDFEFTLFTP